MALKTYNGFDHNQRMRGYRWLQGEYAAGRRARPTVCDACGQTEGPIEAHSESYAAPFGGHIGRYGLCYRCHMTIHNRFKNPRGVGGLQASRGARSNLPPDRQELPALLPRNFGAQRRSACPSSKPLFAVKHCSMS